MFCYLIVNFLWGKQNFVRIRGTPICSNINNQLEVTIMVY